MKEQFFARATENLVKGNPACMEAKLKKSWDARIEAQLNTQCPQMLTEVALQVAKAQQSLYKEHITAVKQSFENTPLSELEGLLRCTAAKMGLTVVPWNDQGRPKTMPTILVPDSQDTHMGDTPLSPQQTVDVIDKLVTDKQTAGSNVVSSMHNPDNAMIDNNTNNTPPPSVQKTVTTPQFPNLPPTLENALLQALLAGVTKVNDCMDNFERCLLAAEGHKPNNPRPTAARPQALPPLTKVQPTRPAPPPANCALPAPKPCMNTRCSVIT